MNPRNIGAAAITTFAVLVIAFEVAAWTASSRLGVSATFSGNCAMRVSSVGAAAAASGLRAGDKIDLTKTDYVSRLVLVMQSDAPIVAGQVGDVLRYAIDRGGSPLTAVIKLANRDAVSTFAINLIFKLLFLGIGLFVLWRGRDAATLWLGIWTVGISLWAPSGWYGAWSPAGRLAGSGFAAFLWSYSPLPLYFIIESLARGIVSRRIVLVARSLVATSVGIGIFEVVVNGLARVATGCVILPVRTVNDIAFVATQVILVAFFFAAYLSARGELRQRISWVFWSFVISRFGVFANLFARVSGHPLQLYDTEWLTLLVFPAGCAYAILRHRLMDVNFVINRAIVYTVLTTIVVGGFLAVETLFQHFAVNRGISLAVELGLAIGVGLSMNTVHQRVEGLIERVLFRRKHQAESVLRSLAADAAFVENPETLLGRTVDDIASSMGTRDVAIYERSASAYKLVRASDHAVFPATIDADDPAFIRLRRSQSDIDLSEMTSALGSGFAFPLSVRGRLFGALVCGQRDEEEPFSPDERELLHNVAREIAAELHLIRARELSELAGAIASGSLEGEAAREKARSLTITSE